MSYLFTLDAEMTSDLHAVLKSAMPLNSRCDMFVDVVCLKHCDCLCQLCYRINVKNLSVYKTV